MLILRGRNQHVLIILSIVVWYVFDRLCIFSALPSVEKCGAEISEDKPTAILSPRHAMEKIAVFQNAHIEELKLPEIMLPVTTASTKKGKWEP